MNYKDTREVYIEAKFRKLMEDERLIPAPSKINLDLFRRVFDAGVAAATEPIMPGHCERIDQIMEAHKP